MGGLLEAAHNIIFSLQVKIPELKSSEDSEVKDADSTSSQNGSIPPAGTGKMALRRHADNDIYQSIAEMCVRVL